MNAITATPAECSSHRAFELPEHDFQELLPAPPIDRDRLLERCLNNWDFALTLLDAFETTSPARLAAFDAALAEHDHAAIASAAHGFKGVVGVLGGNAMTQICLNLESASKDADWNQTRELIPQLHCEVRRMIDFIPNIRAGVN